MRLITHPHISHNQSNWGIIAGAFDRERVLATESYESNKALRREEVCKSGNLTWLQRVPWLVEIERVKVREKYESVNNSRMVIV